MPFPKTETELRAAGYEPPPDGKESKCRGCGAALEFWRTPKGKIIPLEAGSLEPHWTNCPNADEFRR
jgi:hypothetical protein